MISVGIVGVTGYSGMEAFKILLNHPEVRVTYVSANNTTGPLSEIWPQFEGRTKLVCNTFDLKKAAKCDCVFLAVPHKIAMSITPELLKRGVKVIDISGDYRLDSAAEYKKWYGTPHTDRGNLKKAVYGLPELFREEIKTAELIANPGCYPTAAILGLAPAVSILGEAITNITIDAKSGVTGAGRKASVRLNFGEVNENFYAYKPLKHQHIPEMNLYLSKMSPKPLDINFVPHLLPINRGILETIYIYLSKNVTAGKMQTLYKRFYKTEPFVRVLAIDTLPQLKNVTHSNFCDIGLTMGNKGKLLVIHSAIDNLGKGAASQAVQNMNLMFECNETEGLL